MDLMDDEETKKSVIDQMMGELDDVTADSLKKPAGPVKGVEIAITVTPKSGDEMDEAESGEEMPKDEDDDEDDDKSESSDYIQQLLKKLG